MAKNKPQPNDDVTPPDTDAPGQASHIHPNPEPEIDPVTLADSQTAADEAVSDTTQEAGTAEADSPETSADSGHAAELREQLLRAVADFENYKRRASSEQSRSVALARTGVILSLVPVIDNFERAFKTVPEQIASDPWYGGVQAIKQQFESVLKDLGIERIKSVGEPFDPNLHEAVTTEPSDEHAENVVSEEFEAGYKLGDEVIRHARVKVSSGNI